MQRSYAAALFTTLLLSMGLTACGGEEHEKAVDKVAEAEELAKANAPKVTLDEPATIQADTAEKQESDAQEDANKDAKETDTQKAETQETDTQKADAPEKEAEKSDNTDEKASAEQEENSNSSATEEGTENKAEEKAN